MGECMKLWVEVYALFWWDRGGRIWVWAAVEACRRGFRRYAAKAEVSGQTEALQGGGAVAVARAGAVARKPVGNALPYGPRLRRYPWQVNDRILAQPLGSLATALGRAVGYGVIHMC